MAARQCKCLPLANLHDRDATDGRSTVKRPVTLTGWQTALMPDEPFLLIRLMYVEPDKPSIQHQHEGRMYALKAADARQLAQVLLDLADQLDQRPGLLAPRRHQ